MEKNHSKIRLKKFIKNTTDRINEYIFPALKTLFFLFLIGFIIFVIFSWNFDKSDKIFKFLEKTLWPIIVLLSTFLFKNDISLLLSKGITIIFPGGQRVDLGHKEPKQGSIKNDPKSDEIESFKKEKEEKSKQIQELGKNKEELGKKLISTQMYLDFERIYRLIFGSQMNLLKQLRQLFPSGELYRDTLINFIQTQKNFPVLNTWKFDDYLTFLYDNQLIFLKNERLFITDKGKAFLAYCEILNFIPKGL